MRVIDRLIFRFFDKLFIPKKVVQTASKKKLRISLQFLGKQSLILKKRLQQIIREELPFCKINIIFTSQKRLGNFFKFKDSVPRNLKSRLLYRYTCGNCNITYIGKTMRHFQVRYSEHLGISKVTNKPLTYNSKTATAVTEHLHKNNHKSTSECFKIIGAARNDYHLKIK